MENSGKIKSLEIKDLFGISNNSFKLDFFDDLNIFTGRNGSGKTTIMKILWYAISGRFDLLSSEMNFSYLKLITTEVIAEIHAKEDEHGFRKFNYEINYTKIKNGFNDFKGNQVNVLPKIQDYFHASLFFPTFRRIEGGFSIGTEKKGETNLYEAMQQLSQRLSNAETSLTNHRFIAYAYTNDLGAELNQKAVKIGHQKDYINHENNKKIEELAEKNLQKVEELAEKNLAKEILEIRKQTAQQIAELEKPFTVLNELIVKFLQKSVSISENFTFGNINEAIFSQNLSAGEKQLLSFLCYNIFAENACIFIDEPEISLHPDWQRTLIPLLLKQSSSNQLFLATHSYLMVAPYQHREIELNIDKGL